MNRALVFALIVVALTFSAILAACSPAATRTPASVPSAAPPTAPAAEVTSAPRPTALPSTSPPQVTPAPTTLPPPPIEPRLVEYEWPEQIRLGDTDLIRISLIPYQEGYVAVAEFDDHTTQFTQIDVPRPEGYDLWAIARLDASGFELSPDAEQTQAVPVGQAVTWRWSLKPQSAGRQRIALTLTLGWTPTASSPPAAFVRQTTVWSQALTIRITSIFGLSTGQARAVGVTSAVLAGALSIPLFGLTLRERRQRQRAERAPRTPGHIPAAAPPNPALILDLPHGTNLSSDDAALLRSAFHAYARLTIEDEYVSGYSGARTFLALPTRPDGHPDARAIIKLGQREAIAAEYRNYENYVKRTLPPVTARIQEPPVILTGPNAVLRYTFVAAPNQSPRSLREFALARPASETAALLETLFDTFGPNWWLQNRSASFTAASEYDRLLPAHLVMEPVEGRAKTRERVSRLRARPFDLATDSLADLSLGEVVSLRGITERHLRADGSSWTLIAPGPNCPIRIRFHGPHPTAAPTGKIIATGRTLLGETIVGLLPGYRPDSATLPPPFESLANPLIRLDELLAREMTGKRSIIHGDLNLENVLAGPGNLVWLIDFAETREGHTLYDFARLEAELIAHVAAPMLRATGTDHAHFAASISDSLRISSTGYANGVPSTASFFDLRPTFETLHRLAFSLLAESSRPDEYALALYFSTFGALKFPNLDADQKRLLLVCAANLAFLVPA